MHGWGGVGHVITFMWTCGGRTCFFVAAGRCMYARVGWGGACNNVHVNLRRKDMLLCKFSGTFHGKFFGTFHSCVMPRYCRFSGTFHVFMWCWRCTLNNPDPQRFLEELEALLWSTQESKHVRLKFSQTPKMVVSSRRNACFWTYAPE